MRRLINVMAVMIMLCVACDGEDFWRVNVYSHRDRFLTDSTSGRADGGRQGDSLESQPVKQQPHLYVSAVEYPEDYDWKRDESYGIIGAEVILFRDGEEICRLLSGAGNPVYTDEDKHRINGGHLYCDYCIEGQTVWTCDGEELFRLEGQWLSRGFTTRGDNRYVLSEPLSAGEGNSGINLFKEGGLVYQSEGQISSELYLDENKLCFSFYDAEGSAKLFVDGQVLPVPRPQGKREAHKVRYYEDRVYALHQGSSNVDLYVDGEFVCSADTPYYSYFLPHPFPVRKIFVEQQPVSFVVELKQSDSTSTSYHYEESEMVHTYEGESCFTAFYSEKPDLWFLGYNGKSRTYSLYEGEKKYREFPAGWRPHCIRACEMAGNVFRIGFDTPEGPVLWSSDGDTLKWSFNGYIDELLTVME